MIQYGIASYHRPECLTAQTLLNIGVSSEAIMIFVNTEEDASDYKYAWGNKLPIRFKLKHNVAGNRNNILENADKSCDLVILDDDIASFRWLDTTAPNKGGKWTPLNAEELEKKIEETFAEARKAHADMWGVAYTEQSKQRLLTKGVYAINKNFQGGFNGFLNRDLRFDESYNLQDDYEINLRIIAGGGNILRRNDLAAHKGKMGGNPGGCQDLYRQGEQEKCLRKLEQQYPGMFRMYKDHTGGRFIWR